ncbi:MAG: hypothetical protein BWY88_00536 [Synergistetes bacterium ADurb.Bin520]|nr:MAG: hypothetical protein BWY88_00536 [Synergistetes bacterium ADurb.Bin520]
MTERFENVTVLAKANVYFDGKVISHTVLFADGTRKTVGAVLPGEYSFGTGDREHMEIVAGTAEVLLPGSSTWTKVSAGEFFDVPGNSRFSYRCDGISEYICSYIKE